MSRWLRTAPSTPTRTSTTGWCGTRLLEEPHNRKEAMPFNAQNDTVGRLALQRLARLFHSKLERASVPFCSHVKVIGALNSGRTPLHPGDNPGAIRFF